MSPFTTSMAPRLATRMQRMKASAVREILKVTERPDIISFAGGLPAPELFPVTAVARACAETLAEEGAAALQYSTTEGHRALRAWICERLERRGIRCGIDEVLITSGSQQGIDLAAKVLLDAGDEVVVENPSYLAALQVFAGYEASLLLVRGDDDGLDPEDLERVVAEHAPKLLYVVPEFQNPRGTTLSRPRRERLVRIARERGIVIVEDDPYGELRYRGRAEPPLAALAEGADIIYLSTFSKTLAPGLRIGWAVAPEPLARQLAVAKQAADLHTGSLVQRAVARLLAGFDYEAHLARIRGAYGERLDAMLAALERYFPEGTRWTRPDGGLFIWVELPRGVSGEALLPEAVAAGVAFVPGAPFFAGDPRRNMVRLNFSNQMPQAIDEGMRRLGRVLGSALAVGAEAYA